MPRRNNTVTRALRAIKTLEQLLPTMAPDDRQDILDRLATAAQPSAPPAAAPSREETIAFLAELCVKTCNDLDPEPTLHRLQMFCDGVLNNPKNALSIACFPCNAWHFYCLAEYFAAEHPQLVDPVAYVGELVDSELAGRSLARGDRTAVYKAVAAYLGKTVDNVVVDYGRYKKRAAKANRQG